MCVCVCVCVCFARLWPRAQQLLLAIAAASREKRDSERALPLSGDRRCWPSSSSSSRMNCFQSTTPDLRLGLLCPCPFNSRSLFERHRIIPNSPSKQRRGRNKKSAKEDIEERIPTSPLATINQHRRRRAVRFFCVLLTHLQRTCVLSVTCLERASWKTYTRAGLA